MGTFLKYAFYVALIFIIYVVVSGFYEGKITKNSTVSEVGTEVSENAGKILNKAYNKAKTETENAERAVEVQKEK